MSPWFSITMATSGPVRSEPYKNRHTLFTWNNYTPDDVEHVKEYIRTQCTYGCFGLEVAPTTGTPHIQGYVRWSNKRSLEAFKKCMHGKIHYGDANGRTDGTSEQNRRYCAGLVEKKGNVMNPSFWEYGEISKQGERTDWSEAVAAIQRGDDITEVIEAQPQLLPCVRALEKFKTMMLKPKHREVNVITLIGDSGSGKTRYAYDNYPDLYSKPRGDWWDGYTGQKTILLDDYYGYLPYCELLRVLDRYPYQVPIKGGFVQAQWDTVIITSNKPPGHWYKDLGLTDALRRRLKNIIHYSIIDGTTIHETVPL